MNTNGGRRPRRLLLRIGLASAMTLVGLNIWTGSPLLAVWVGSRVQGSQPTLKMITVGVVILTMGSSAFVLYQLLQRLDHCYGQVIGRKSGTRQPVPWLKSISGERVPAKRPREPLTAAERIMVLLVVIAIALFEAWFFFFAGNSLPH